MKRGKAYTWIPLWIDKWLMGSTRFELDPAERSVFLDLMVLAAKDDGFIRANPEMGYPSEYLSRILNIPAELLSSTLEKCKIHEKIQFMDNGIFYIKNWNSYSLNERSKRRYSENVRLSDKLSGNRSRVSVSVSVSCISINSKGEYEGVTDEDIKNWAEAYPACDVRVELKRSAEWIKANPSKRKSNYRRFIVNWLSRQQDRGGTNRSIGNRSADINEPDWVKKGRVAHEKRKAKENA